MGPRGTGLVNDAVCTGTGTGTAAGTGAGNDTGGPGSGGSGWLGWVAWCGWASWTGWTGWIAAGGPSWVVRGGRDSLACVLGPGVDCVLESWLLRGGSIVHRCVRGVCACVGCAGGAVADLEEVCGRGCHVVLFIVVGAAKSQSQCECERTRERGAGGGVVAPDDATCASSEPPPATARGEKREARGLPFVLLYLRSGSDCWRHAHLRACARVGVAAFARALPRPPRAGGMRRCAGLDLQVQRHRASAGRELRAGVGAKEARNLADTRISDTLLPS